MTIVSLSLVSGNLFQLNPGIYHLITGGEYEVGDDWKYEDKVLMFDIKTKTWRQIGVMKVARYEHAVSLVDYTTGLVDCSP